MRTGSLFTGIGGFDLGFEQSGISNWQREAAVRIKAYLASKTWAAPIPILA
jgi:site-specific DNA-cytosine methylase